MAGLIHPPIALLLAQKIPSWWEDIYIYINIIYIYMCVCLINYHYGWFENSETPK